MLRNLKQRGDTIIEVILAFTVFALLAVGAMTVMNRGVASAQRSLETTLVRQQMDGQAEALRFLHAAYIADPEALGDAAEFKKIMTAPLTLNRASDFGVVSCTHAIPNISEAFVVRMDNKKIISGTSYIKPIDVPTAKPFAQVIVPPDVPNPISYGLWIEAVKSQTTIPAADKPTFIDFHIRACWFSPTGSHPITLGTIVRLYVPAE